MSWRKSDDYKVEKPDKYLEKIQELKVRCPYCGHTIVIPVFVDKQICSYCKRKVQNNSLLYFKYKMRNELEKNNEKKIQDRKDI